MPIDIDCVDPLFIHNLRNNLQGFARQFFGQVLSVIRVLADGAINTSKIAPRCQRKTHFVKRSGSKQFGYDGLFKLKLSVLCRL